MLEVKNLSHNYGSNEALKNISFEIDTGDVVGLLGRNGAGKTTLMRLLTTYFKVQSGSIVLGEKDLTKNINWVKKHVGYLPETPPLYPQMTVKEYLTYIGKIKDIPSSQLSAAIEHVLKECHLENSRHQYIERLSKGYRQRVGIAQAIIHDPQLVILDEPFTGLDPMQVQDIRKLIDSFKEKRTVIFSTHVLSEVEEISTRVLMIREGQLIVNESLEDLLKETTAKKSLEMLLEGEPLNFEKVMEKFPFMRVVQTKVFEKNMRISIHVDREIENFNGFINECILEGFVIKGFRQKKMGLEAIFLKYHGVEEHLKNQKVEK